MKAKRLGQFALIALLMLPVGQARAQDAAKQACDYLTHDAQFFADSANDLYARVRQAISGVSPRELRGKNYNDHNRLAATIASQFSQPDDIDGSGAGVTGKIHSQRDLYTYCPSGSVTKRPVLECVGGGHCLGVGYCEGSDSQKLSPELTIYNLWVSNVKHPTLTLELVGADYGHGGEHLKVNIDLNRVKNGKFSARDLLKAIWPYKSCPLQDADLTQSSSERVKVLPAQQTGAPSLPSNSDSDSDGAK